MAISEGEVSVLAVVYDPETKKYRTEKRVTKIESIVYTTTQPSPPPVLSNRLTILNSRDDPKQSGRVVDSQLETAQSFPWEKVDWAAERDAVRRAIWRVWNKGPAEVVVPFARALKPLFHNEDTAVRRHAPRILSLVKASARLNYLHRESASDGKGVYAHPDDLALVFWVGLKALESTLSAMTERVSLILDVCKFLNSKSVDITSEAIALNAGENRPRLGGRSSVRAGIRDLAEWGILTRRPQKEGKFYVYDLHEDFDTPVAVNVPRLLEDAVREYDLWTMRRNPEGRTPFRVA